MEDTNREAPAPGKKKELKSFIFTRTIQSNEKTPKCPKDEKENNQENIDKFILEFTLNLYEDEIVFNVKQRKENFKVANIIYEKGFLPEFFKSYKILSSISLEKVFDFIQKSFELNFDSITFEEKELKIKLMINLMDVLTEEINLELPMIKMANQDEVLSLKETIKFLENERTNLKKEIISINATLEQLKNVIENNKIEFQKKLEELQKKFEDNNTAIQTKMEDNKAEINNKIENNSIEINNKIENNKAEVNNKIENNSMRLIIRLKRRTTYVKIK